MEFKEFVINGVDFFGNEFVVLFGISFVIGGIYFFMENLFVSGSFLY